MIAGSFIAVTALAADDFLVQKGLEQLSAARQEVGILIREMHQGSGPSNATQSLKQIHRRLLAAEQSLNESFDGDSTVPHPLPGPNRTIMSAKCEFDDDPQFDEGQIIFGKIGGYSIVDATNQCAGIAKAMFGANGSSGLRNIVQR